MRVKIVLDKFEIKILETLVQLDEYMKPGLLEIDKVSKTVIPLLQTFITHFYWGNCLQYQIKESVHNNQI